MSMFKRIVAVLCCVAQLLCLSGCMGTTIFSASHEIEKIEIIRTLGVDLSETGVCLTADSGVGLNGTPPRLYRQEAATLATAIDILENTYPDRQPFFTHTENLLIGEQAAKAGISSWLDYIARSPSMRLLISLVVVRNEEAGAVMEEVMSEKTSVSDMLFDIAADVQMQGAGSMTNCGQASAQLLESGCTMVQAVAAVAANGSAGAEQMLVPYGFALLKDGKLTGYLGPELAAEVNILTGKFEAANMAVKNEETSISLHFTKASAEFKPVYVGNRLVRVDVAVSAQADVSEAFSKSNQEHDHLRAEIEQAAASQMQADMQQAIAVTQKLDGDYLGIGKEVEMAAPAAFRAMETPWATLYSDLEVCVSVQVTLRQTYDLDTPTAEGGENHGR
jgi:spore germination protein KC